MASINTNMLSLTAQNKSSHSASALSQSIERLSSGLRVNSAKDDAAGQAIANRMTSNLNANDVIARGVNDGISLMQIAEGGLGEVNNLVQRARELAVQAANETLSSIDRASLNGEFQQVRAEIDRIAYSTTAFGKYPLAPATQKGLPVNLGNTPPLMEKFPISGMTQYFSSGVVSLAYIPTGAENLTITIDSYGMDDDIQIFSRNGQHLTGTPLEGVNADIVWKQNGVTSAAIANNRVLTQENGFEIGASYSAENLAQGGVSFSLNGSSTVNYNGMTIAYSGDGDRYEAMPNDGSVSAQTLERIHIDKTTEDLIVLVIGQGSFEGVATWDVLPNPTRLPPPPLPPVSTPTDIVVSANYGEGVEAVTINPTPSDSESLGLRNTALDPFEEARKAIDSFDQALEKINGYRSEYGSQINRFESVRNTTVEVSTTLSTARSRILDADYAQEISLMTKQQILQQASSSMLVQANQAPQVMLMLLQR
ncbi:flagellin [Pectobacterium polaris]|uniref:flagellin N-terminal helical domain-containing protein n=1 Tax=Pectobacterium polaris TaxID=2042057 RepID=UPI0023B0A744|nr:flagellin [Pectobacterium polaris]MDE8756444.1 flagellin [Pectobacterium polaris]